MNSVVISTIILTILSISVIANVALMWQVFKTHVHVSNMLESMNQILPACVDTLNESQELINEKKGLIGLER